VKTSEMTKKDRHWSVKNWRCWLRQEVELLRKSNGSKTVRKVFILGLQDRWHFWILLLLLLRCYFRSFI